MNKNNSSRLFPMAKKVMPGGVNSPVRAFKAVGGDPLFIKRAKGSRIIDVDNNEFIDYVSSWGPLIFGHAHPEIVNAISRQAELGSSYGASTELEIQLAEKVVQAVPSIELVRMVSSGTEAVMSALRLARGITGRDKILKFEGCYHGHSDSLLVKAGSGLVSLGIPECPGIVSSLAEKTLNRPYNNIAKVRELFENFRPIEVVLRFGSAEPRSYFGCFCGISSDNRNSYGFFDLEMEQSFELIQGDNDHIMQALENSPKQIRTISINNAPPVLPVNSPPDSWVQICENLKTKSEFGKTVGSGRSQGWLGFCHLRNFTILL